MSGPRGVGGVVQAVLEERVGSYTWCTTVDACQVCNVYGVDLSNKQHWK